ncbi:MAG: CreA family protein [Campylobacteraceae bacterium]|nr:CreA family protein [Campylobacteraceae bacterium]
MKKLLLGFLVCLGSLFANDDDINKIGSVTTAWKLLGKNDRIEVISVKDPKVDGVTCFLSYAKKGGTSEIVGLEEDTSNASVSCVQTDQKIIIKEKIDGDKESIFKKRSSVLFKKTQVVRMYDPKSQTLIYLAYSDRLIDGSPNNSVSAIPCNQAVGNVCEFRE